MNVPSELTNAWWFLGHQPLRTLALTALLHVTTGQLAPAGAQGEIPKPTIRDSAGVRIVDYRSLRGPLPSVRIEAPYLDLGGVHLDEHEELDPRQPWLSATELANGTIVVNEFAQLKFFDRSGKFVRTAGRRGAGPGEFNQTREVCRLRGDTLLVIDYSNGRLTVWDSAGRHVRTYNRPGFIPFRGCVPDGTVIVQSAPGTAGADATSDPVRDYALAHLDGSVIGRLGALPAPVYAGPIMREPSIVPVGDELNVGGAKVYEVSVQSLSGRLRRIIRVADPPRRVTATEWREKLERMVPRI